ncbi:MAG: A/G-specific adenine glycosylase [Chrysiogenales bacterium]|nr:MAG: A/G-specific adenine glycosylase [Chrysiogenales bacterium]
MGNESSYNDEGLVRDYRERYSAALEDATSGGVSERAAARFRSIIYRFYTRHLRDFPWRRTADPYHILVSEIMLQQTQVGRVAEKFPEFIDAFPTPTALADATLARVLAVWQGLGYNRRAGNLHRLAAAVVEEHDGMIPDDPDLLARLPGIGRATAASICAFAFNRPVAFIETNIRAVFIHFFFPDRERVDDREILPLVESVLDRSDPRAWYSALMDYGSMLKKRHPNPSRRSARHRRQSPFKGSRRQLRGEVIRILLHNPGVTVRRLSLIAERPEAEVREAVEGLIGEGLAYPKGKGIFI